MSAGEGSSRGLENILLRQRVRVTHVERVISQWVFVEQRLLTAVLPGANFWRSYLFCATSRAQIRHKGVCGRTSRRSSEMSSPHRAQTP